MRESSKGSGAALQPVQMPGEAAWTTGLLCYHLTIKGLPAAPGSSPGSNSKLTLHKLQGCRPPDSQSDLPAFAQAALEMKSLDKPLALSLHSWG